MRTHRQTVGVKPFSGLRFVEKDRVKIVWYPGGQPRERVIPGPVSAKTLKLADDILRKALERARHRKDGPAKPETDDQAPVTLGELLRKHYEDSRRRKSQRTGKHLRPATLRLFGQHQAVLERELANMDGENHLNAPARDLRRPVVRALIQTLQNERKLADKTVATIVDYLAQVYRWACSEVEMLDANPISGVKVPSRKGGGQAYSTDEALRILAAARADRGHRRDWRIRLLVELEAVYGARSLQVIGLTWADVRFDEVFEATLPGGKRVRFEGVIHLRQEAAGSKGQPDRSVPMFPAVREALLAAWNSRMDDQGFVLWNWQDSGKHVTYQAMNTSLKRLEGFAKVKHIKGRAFHAFRRTLGTALAGAVGAKAAADLIGDTIAVTMKSYVKPTKEHLAAGAVWMLEHWLPGANRESGNEGEQGTVEGATA